MSKQHPRGWAQDKRQQERLNIERQKREAEEQANEVFKFKGKRKTQLGQDTLPVTAPKLQAIKKIPVASLPSVTEKEKADDMSGYGYILFIYSYSIPYPRQVVDPLAESTCLLAGLVILYRHEDNGSVSKVGYRGAALMRVPDKYLLVVYEPKTKKTDFDVLVNKKFVFKIQDRNFAVFKSNSGNYAGDGYILIL